jgi:hypothetical protein
MPCLGELVGETGGVDLLLTVGDLFSSLMSLLLDGEGGGVGSVDCPVGDPDGGPTALGLSGRLCNDPELFLERTALADVVGRLAFSFALRRNIPLLKRIILNNLQIYKLPK